MYKSCTVFTIGLLLLVVQPIQAETPPTRLPDQTLASLESETSDLRELNLRELHGKVLVVNFWATWCPPCLHELPSLVALSEALDDSTARVVLISEDLTTEKAARFLAQRGWHGNTIRLFDAGGSYLRAVKARGLPTTLLVSPEGEIVERVQGIRDWNSPEIRTRLRNIASGGAS